jgi:hypothetical protein
MDRDQLALGFYARDHWFLSTNIFYVKRIEHSRYQIFYLDQQTNVFSRGRRSFSHSHDIVFDLWTPLRFLYG